jgi:hypothetical protein
MRSSSASSAGAPRPTTGTRRLPLDGLEMVIWTRRQAGIAELSWFRLLMNGISVRDALTAFTGNHRPVEHVPSRVELG